MTNIMLTGPSPTSSQFSYMTQRGPRGADLTGRVRRTHQWTIGSGAFTDVYRGEWKVAQQVYPIQVAIKIFRGVHNDKEVLEAITRRLIRESNSWFGLEHPNVQPYYGHCNPGPDIGPSMALISPYCENGTVVSYLYKHPEANRAQFVVDIAKGLEYIHSKEVIHGDLQGNNVLIDDQGVARLSDFGRARVIGHQGYSTTLIAGCAMYMAPELFLDDQDEDADDEADPEFVEPPFSKKSDVYAFSMLGFEIFTGRTPFQRGPKPRPIHATTIMTRIRAGKRPEREGDQYRQISDTVWRLLEDCWMESPELRPSSLEIVQRLTYHSSP